MEEGELTVEAYTSIDSKGEYKTIILPEGEPENREEALMRLDLIDEIIKQNTQAFKRTRQEYFNHCTALLNRALSYLKLDKLVVCKATGKIGRLYPQQNKNRPYGVFNIRFVPYKKDGVTPYKCCCDNTIFNIECPADAFSELQEKYEPIGE
jgi:hypothetical protein